MSRLSSRALAFLAATAAGLVATPAAAQSSPAGALASLSWSKSEAILGGPSALQAMLAQQGALPPRVSPIQPASLSRPPVLPAVVRVRPRLAEGVASGRPDLFGTVALRVTRTPLDARWRRAEAAPVGGSAAAYARSLSGLDPVERLEAVNRYVNRRVRFTDDEARFGRADVWSSAGETLRRGRGDCEDYAIAKLQMLRSAGLAERDLYLVIVKDLVRRSDHAVLVVRAAGAMHVLDNGTDQLLDSESISDYRPVLTFAASGAWTHGYRVRSAPVEIASAPAEPLAPAADTQRSRSDSFLAFNTGLTK